MYILGLAPFRMSDVGRKEVDILRLGLEVILLEAVACADFSNTLTIKLGQFASTTKFVQRMQTAQTFLASASVESPSIYSSPFYQIIFSFL
jgi:hypothetical protein